MYQEPLPNIEPHKGRLKSMELFEFEMETDNFVAEALTKYHLNDVFYYDNRALYNHESHELIKLEPFDLMGLNDYLFDHGYIQLYRPKASKHFLDKPLLTVDSLNAYYSIHCNLNEVPFESLLVQDKFKLALRYYNLLDYTVEKVRRGRKYRLMIQYKTVPYYIGEYLDWNLTRGLNDLNDFVRKYYWSNEW